MLNYEIIADNMRAFIARLADVIGIIVLISYFVPWFLIAVAFMFVIYVQASFFYRSSARELKVGPLNFFGFGFGFGDL